MLICGSTIIYCTGYNLYVPVAIEPQELNPYPHIGAPPQLYRNTFPLHPDPTIRNSLAFLGQGAIAFPGFAPHEAIGLCVSQIWQGKSSLPPLSDMKRWHQDYLTWREDTIKQYNAKSTFYTVFVPTTDHIDWVDATAGLGLRQHFGLVERWTNLDAWRFWWNDRKLYYQCLNGLTSPAIFRLFDMGKRKAWAGARDQIFTDDERAVKQQQDRLKGLEKQKTV
jgi:dimethylaniline monooxygenase (N-oxide forming)